MRALWHGGMAATDADKRPLGSPEHGPEFAVENTIGTADYLLRHSSLALLPCGSAHRCPSQLEPMVDSQRRRGTDT